MTDQAAPCAGRGVAFGLIAYLLWGFFPIYFKLLAEIPPPQVLAHRIAWSVVFLLPLCALSGRLADLRRLFSDGRALALLACTTLLIAANWLIFIYAVGAGKILESSLGYFINPLVSALLGRLFLAERMSPLQQLAILLAVAGVATRTLQLGHFPWIAISLGVSFGLYGLLRKRAGGIDPISGLTVETSLLFLPALIYLFSQAGGSPGHLLPEDTLARTLLILSGMVTAIPLILFAAATRRLRLTTIGFLQYITPTLHLLIAVLLYGESFTAANALCFALIWAGVALYSYDAVRRLRSAASTTAKVPADGEGPACSGNSERVL